jgi:hypothetical protein
VLAFVFVPTTSHAAEAVPNTEWIGPIKECCTPYACEYFVVTFGDEVLTDGNGQEVKLRIATNVREAVLMKGANDKCPDSYMLRGR